MMADFMNLHSLISTFKKQVFKTKNKQTCIHIFSNDEVQYRSKILALILFFFFYDVHAWKDQKSLSSLFSYKVVLWT